MDKSNEKLEDIYFLIKCVDYATLSDYGMRDSLGELEEKFYKIKDKYLSTDN